MKQLLTILLMFAGVILLTVPVSHAGTKQAERSPANPDLSPSEMDAVNRLFQQLRAAFLANDADACMRLFADAKDRQKIYKSLQREFQQSHYTKFEILQVVADDSERRLHTLDVTFSFKLTSRDGSHELENSTNHSFVVRKMDDGSFALVNSSFFNGLGLKSEIDLVIDALLAIMSIFVVLSFWVWMGCEAFRLRPRSVSWRMVVLFVPVIGAVTFFLGKYLATKLYRSSAANSVQI